jgi:hypothetical protein
MEINIDACMPISLRDALSAALEASPHVEVYAPSAWGGLAIVERFTLDNERLGYAMYIRVARPHHVGEAGE